MNFQSSIGLILAWAVLAPIAFGQVPAMPAAVPLPTAKVQFLDVNGHPLAGGKVYTYAAGTTTPLATYTDATAGTPNTNPVVLDSGGFANIWISGNTYKIVVQNSASLPQWTADNVTDTTFFYIQHLKYVSDSSVLSYRLKGSPTGSITRPVLDKLSETLSVQDFGAVGDGTTDDTVAIQTAINAAGARGGLVKFPNATYLVSVAHGTVIALGNSVPAPHTACITVPSNVRLDLGSSTIKMANASTNSYTIIAFVNASNSSLTGGYLLGDRASHSSGEWGFGVGVYSSNYIDVGNVSVSNSLGDNFITGTMVGQPGSSYVSFHNCTSKLAGRNGAAIVSGTHITFSSFSASGCGQAPSYSAGRPCIDLESEDITNAISGVVLTDLQLESGGVSSNGIVNPISDVVINGGYINGSTYEGVGIYYVSNVSVANLVVNGSANSGIATFSNTSGVSISHNLVTNSAQDGIHVFAGTNATISNNLIIGSGTSGASYSGIATLSGDTNTVISGNVVRQGTGLSTSAISIGGSINPLIENNDLLGGAATNAILDLSSTSVQLRNRDLAGNIISNVLNTPTGTELLAGYLKITGNMIAPLGFFMNNTMALNGKDTAGIYRKIIQYDASNEMVLGDSTYNPDFVFRTTAGDVAKIDASGAYTGSLVSTNCITRAVLATLSPADGAMKCVTDSLPGGLCSVAGGGALALRIGGTWVCK